MWIVLVAVPGALLLWALYDITQRRHAIIRNFPIIGHFRYWLEAVGPELRQYIVTGNDEERPFSRDQRRWVYASSKRENNYFGFGTDNDLELTPSYVLIKQSTFPYAPPAAAGDHDDLYPVSCAKILGGFRERRKAFRPASIVNISAMSYGSLSASAVEAVNRGCRLADCLHNTGEGGVSPHHAHGGDLTWQIGTGYFGCRDEEGRFSMDRLVEMVEANRIRAIEVKLSQGAKPGLGGVLPAEKISPEIAAIRGIPMGRDCISPSTHTTFRDADGMLDFVESIAEKTGLPVGIKSAVGELTFWRELADLIGAGGRAVDFITIDGGEGGTGAAPLVFADHVALPFKIGFSRVYSVFAERSLQDRVVFNGSGKLGFPADALLAMALGCDTVNVAREAMLAIGCIQAQRCHTGHCPTGVATQNRWLMRGLDPTLKAARLANYVATLRKDLLRLSHACGQAHPALVTLEHFDILGEQMASRSGWDVFSYDESWGSCSEERRSEIVALTTSVDA